MTWLQFRSVATRPDTRKYISHSFCFNIRNPKAAICFDLSPSDLCTRLFLGYVIVAPYQYITCLNGLHLIRFLPLSQALDLQEAIAGIKTASYLTEQPPSRQLLTAVNGNLSPRSSCYLFSTVNVNQIARLSRDFCCCHRQLFSKKLLPLWICYHRSYCSRYLQKSHRWTS